MTLVVGASYCGAVVASFVARELGVSVAFVNTDSGFMQYHRMYHPEPGQHVLIVDDLVCTGRDVSAIAAFLRSAGQEVAGISAWLSRVNLPAEQLLTLTPAPFQTYTPESCPLCSAGVPIVYSDIRE
ncbi:phosphoribosyltransferase family protein [Deinococcus radiomollis]|uniref:phosphoribosyltransferase family protein n=1 Tax=Deinococcus radiomollis TaxID=468916 RepID=UPI00389146A5